MTLRGLISGWQQLSGSGSLLEEADNTPAGPPTIYRGCTASPKGAAIRGPGEGSLWAGAGWEASPSHASPGGRGFSSP